MIFDHIKSLSLYNSIIPQTEKIIEYLAKADSLEFGEWQNISPEMKVIKLNQFSKENVFEFHKKFIDVHITVEGIDEIAVGDNEKSTLIGEFNTDLDYQLAESETIATITNNRNAFTIILPGEIHRNRFLTPDTKKLVFKIESNVKA